MLRSGWGNQNALSGVWQQNMMQLAQKGRLDPQAVNTMKLQARMQDMLMRRKAAQVEWFMNKLLGGAGATRLPRMTR